MKLTKKLEKEILKLYHQYWNSYLRGDMQTFASLLDDDDCHIIGSTEFDVFNNKKDAVDFYSTTAEQIAGKADMRNRKITLLPYGEDIMVEEFNDFYFLADNEWHFYAHARLSTLLSKKENCWKIVYQHGSMPDAKTQGGEQLAAAKITEENQQLKEAVKRNTIELRNKNHELEIETALEKVRAIALSMKEPADMLEVCNIITIELDKLGVKEIRNVQTAIFYEDKGTYMNYEYYFKHDKPIITETSYTNHKVHRAFAEQMLKGKGEFFSTHISKSELPDWIAYQKTTNVFIDTYLETASSLNYYWHSLGPVALGISTYQPLQEEDKVLFNRFLKVFELAYRRYLDIEKAEAQAREAQIQLALERVRARAMAMQKSNELGETSFVLFEQFKDLGETSDQISIGIFNEVENIMELYSTLYGSQWKEAARVDLDEPVVMKKIYAGWKKEKKSLVIDLAGNDLKKYNSYRKKLSNLEYKEKRWVIHIAFFSKGVITFSTTEPRQNETVNLLERFAGVFDGTYTRFLDLQKAEAQARESQIQLALERARAQSMMMQHSTELDDTLRVFHQQVLLLGINSAFSFLWLPDEEKERHIFWAAWAENLPAGQEGNSFKSKAINYPLDINEPATAQCLFDWKSNEPVVSYHVPPDGVENYFAAWSELIAGVEQLKPEYFSNGLYYVEAFMKYGCFGVMVANALSEGEKKILDRFAIEFERAYTRFLDLQKAEAQAREAQIELGLERVRARAMAMQTSEELNALIGIVFTELTKLDLVLTRCVIIIYDAETKGAQWWMANSEAPSAPMNFFVKYANLPFFNMYLKGWKERDLKWQYILEGENKIVTDNFLFNETELKTLPDFVIEGMKAPHKVYLNASFNNFGNLTLAALEPLSEKHFDILLRFAKVFDLTYTRFNDLQKAEEQARESQIQLALERVRARTMAMHESAELNQTAELLFEQLRQLGAELQGVAFAICDENNIMVQKWTSIGVFSHPYTIEPGEQRMYEAWKNGEEFYEEVYEGERQKKYYEAFMRIPEFKQGLQKFIDSGYPLPTWQKNHAVIFKYGYLLFITTKPFKETDIFLRFGKVFEQTYTRFLDLQKAEAQAREAQIEAALERVRSRTMGMQKSEELKEVIQIVYNQLSHLKILVEHAGFIIDYKERDDLHIWLADEHLTPSEVTIPAFDSPPNNSIKEAKDNGRDSFKYLLTFEEKNKFYRDLFKFVPGVPEETLEYYFNCRGLAGSGVLLENIGLYIENFSGIPYSDEDNKTLMRFGKVFQQTYTRFLDLQKAEAQVREAHIEASLERVRAKTMAMHKSSDVLEVVKTLGEQFELLGFKFNSVNFNTDIHEQDWNLWLYNVGSAMYPGKIHVPYIDHPCFNRPIEAFRKGGDLHSFIFTKEEKDSFFDHIYTNTVAKYGSDERKRFTYAAPGFAMSTAVTKNTRITIANFKGEPFSEDENAILRRFANVFEQSYTRFLDLQKAEAQARESQIQLALERVRARTMAMQKSDELPEAANLLFQQVQSLEMPAWSAGYCIWNEDKKGITLFMSSEGVMQPSFHAPLTEDPSFIHMREAYEKGETFHVEAVGGEKLAMHYQYMRTLPGIGEILDSIINAGHPLPTFQIFHCVYFSQGFLLFITYEPVTEAHDIFKRFGKVFDQTYTRFLDLQKSEAQSRESQIQLALERVRARTMAMQKSDELKEVIQLILEQFVHLGLETEAAGFMIDYKESNDLNVWVSSPRHPLATQIHIPYFDHPIFKLFVEAKEKGFDFYTVRLTKEEKDTFFTHIFKQLPGFPDDWKQQMYAAPGYADSHVMLNNIALYIQNYTGIPYADVDNAILMRLARAFEQTYTRFLDLQKAETQARESQIQLALERVRARTMAMQKSDELKSAATLLFQQAKALGVPAYSCGYNIWEKGEKEFTSWMSTQDGNDINGVPNIPLTEDANFIRYVESKQNSEPFFVLELRGERMQEHYKYLKTIPAFKEYFDYAVSVGFNLPETQIHYVANFSQGNLLFITLEPCPEFHDIFRRFAAVFEQTYTRFLDLQKAEAQAREAQIEAALEKVRSRSLAVHKSDEFKEVVKIVFEKLQELGIEADAASINIFIESSKDMEVYIGGNSNDDLDIRNFRVLYFDELISNDRYQAQQSGIDFFSKTYNREEKNIYFKYQFEFSEIKNVPDDVRKKILKSEHYTISMALAKHSMIVVNNFEGKLLSHKEIDVLKRFSKVFEQSYVRFLDLQKAEAQARESQIQLALERVRARTMAMFKSDELAETARVLFTEFKKLNVLTDVGIPDRAFISTVNEKKGVIEFWITALDGSQINRMFEGSIKEPIVFSKAYKAWKEQKKSLVVDVSGDDLTKYLDYLKSIHFPVNEELYELHRVNSVAFFSKGFIGITSLTLLPPESIQMMERFAGAFDITYTRFLDLQKAEAQTRESQIQLALERVRARTMAMQKSDELSDAVYILFQQFRELGENPDQATIGIFNEDEKVIEYWVTMYGKPINKVFKFSIDEANVTNKIYNGWKENKKSLVIDLSGDALTEFMTYRAAKGGAAINPNEKRRIINVAFFSKGLLNVQSNEERSEESIKLLERFASVFEQTYTRFLDLKKAEAQGRESQIEASLERVRSKTMAMHNSVDVGETVAVMFDELVKLGIQTYRCGIGIMHDENKMEVWTAKPGAEGKADLVIGWLNMNLHPLFQGAYNGWKKKKEIFSYDLKDDDLINYFNAVNSYAAYPVNYDIASLPREIFHSDFYFAEGTLFAFSLEKLSEEKKKIFKRFSAVFGQTYRRYLDLQKAEAQTREAQIEAALEKVRGRSLAMHKSDEIIEVAKAVFEKLNDLTIEVNTAFIIIFKEGSRDSEWWLINRDDQQYARIFVKYTDLIILKDQFEAKEQGKELFSATYHSEEKKELFRYLFTETDFKYAPPDRQKFIFESKAISISMAMTNKIAIQVTRHNENAFSQEDNEILKRFSKVFDQSYTRFLDLQRAEAQARESQIEASLERVRSRAMAMQTSEELGALIGTVFTELTKLDLQLTRCVIWIFDAQTNGATWWMANSEDSQNPINCELPYNAYEPYLVFLEQWKKKTIKFQYELKGKIKKDWDKYLFNKTGLSRLPDFVIAGMKAPECVLLTASFNNFGAVNAATLEPLPKEHIDVLLRFAKVFDLTYTRFNDLQQAEANAKEAIKQAALDRIRADIASMRTTKDLEKITPLIWNELNILGIPFIRCGVFIMDDEQQVIHTFLSTPDGEAIAAFHIPYDTPGNIKHVINHWHNNKNYIDHWDEEAFTTFAETLVTQGALASPEQYLQTIPHGGFYLHFLPFLQGMLYVGNTTQLSEDEINLIQSLADAFSTAYARYEDFNKLEAAKKQVDKTLLELKQTQQQLVQSEKMASLGELTAGIAHEIQNPLNFVNNFSEVNKELLVEMKDEMDKGNLDDARAIANDVIDNEEKINHHGKRADAIVKGMLQHSRSSSGVKEPTDINALADEYLRLAYHGLRAKDKSFNATMKTNYDETLEKVSVISQDIGRVILNLITNAFYSVNEKAKRQTNGYEPTISVSTKKTINSVTVIVSDNGNGIPQKIVDKIFQPFFTTKPTGEGTGLGLSLSYDIIKAHGGEIKVETNEGAGSQFIIQLPLT